MHTEQQTARLAGNSSGRSQKKTVSQNILPANTQKSIPLKKTSLGIDITEAQRFLGLLDPDGLWNFQTFIEKDHKPARGKKKSDYVYVSEGPETFDQAKDTLISFNKMGAAVAVGINEFNGTRDQDNVVRYRALFVDHDIYGANHPFTQDPKPHIIVQSSETAAGKKFHAYWRIKDTNEKTFRSVQIALARHFSGDKADTNTQSPSKCMRLPGFLHQRYEPVQTKIVEVNPGPTFSPEELIIKYGLSIEEDKGEISREEVNKALQRNQDGDADLFKRLNGERFCYDTATEKWFVWMDHFWEEDILKTSLGAVESITPYYHRVIEDKQRQIDAEQSKEDPDTEAIKTLRKQAESIRNRISMLHSRKRKEDVLFLSAIGEDGLAATGEWDDMPRQLPCLNGVVDLTTGKLRPGDQSDFVRTVVPLEYDPEAKSDLWEAFIGEIHTNKDLQPDEQMAKFVQRLFGYAIMGTGDQDIMPILYGPHGRNGKSTLIGVIQKVLGPFVGVIEKSTLIENRYQSGGGAARQDLLEIQHKRINWISELSSKDKIDTELFKKLTGGDCLKARGLFAKKSVEFVPGHVMFMLTNNRPTIPIRADDSSWSRLKVVVPYYLHFTDTITEPFHRQIDDSIKEKLLEQRQGVLKWLVQGAVEYFNNGLQIPESVKAEAAKYKDDQDAVGRFLSHFVDYPTEKECEIKVSLLYDVFEDWLEGEDGVVIKKKVFKEYLPQFFKDNQAIKDGYGIYRKVKWKPEVKDYAKRIHDAKQNKRAGENKNVT